MTPRTSMRTRYYEDIPWVPFGNVVQFMASIMVWAEINQAHPEYQRALREIFGLMILAMARAEPPA